jgi:hypothetical protein
MDIIATQLDIGPERVISDVTNPCRNWSRPADYWTNQQIKNRRKEVRREVANLIPNAVVKSEFRVTEPLLEQLFTSYDRHFFNSKLKEMLRNKDISVDFHTSDKMTSTAGVCTTLKPGCQYSITISKPLFEQVFSTDDVKKIRINGISCKNRLKCLQLTFEHELTHLIINVFCPETPVPSKTGKVKRISHGKRFEAFVLSMFGHTETTHDILSGDADVVKAKKEAREAMLKKMRKLLKVGEEVYVDDPRRGLYKGQVLKVPASNAVRVSLKLLDITVPDKNGNMVDRADVPLEYVNPPLRRDNESGGGNGWLQ